MGLQDLAFSCGNETRRASNVQDTRISEVEPLDSYAFEINDRSREHLEVKACMLAYMHRMNVDDITSMRQANQQELERIKLQRLVSRSGVMNDNSVMESTTRKTTFLLRHFFALHDS